MSEFEKGKDTRQKKYFSVNKVVTFICSYRHLTHFIG
jgi:hypothetical protein